MKKTWVKINTAALRQNFRNLSSFVGSAKKMSVVKSNAYGHGILECAKIFAEEGADFLGVDDFEEALQIREAGIETPILVLGWTDPENYSVAAEKNISLTISTFDFLKKAIETPNLKIHIKIDTGLHRQGFLLSDTSEVISLIKNSPAQIEGLYTHLAGAETPSLDDYTKKQVSEFHIWIDKFREADINPIKHAGASSVANAHPEIHFDMVRFGIALYGLWPSEEVRAASPSLSLATALIWETKITEIKRIAAGEPVGYDCTEKVSRDSIIAIVPIGYWHGIPRAASRVATFSVEGAPVKILGNVSMDMIVVDVTEIPEAKVGSIVQIIGPENPAEKLAGDCQTINYEIVTRINPEIPRVIE